MLSFSNLKYIVILATIVASFGLGWAVKGWYEDSKDLAAQSAVKEAQRVIAEQLELKLQDLRANEKVIEREKLKVVEKPVYRNECLDADGMQLINQAKRGASKPVN